MYKRQKGALPLITQVLGLFILVYPTFGIFFYAIPKIFRSSGLELMILTITSILLLSFPLSLGWIILFLFPHIKIFEDGIGFMTSPITTKKMKWDEFTFLHEFRNGYGALVMSREGNKLINFLSLYKLYGLFTGVIDPAILLTPDTVSGIRQIAQKFSK